MPDRAAIEAAPNLPMRAEVRDILAPRIAGLNSSDGDLADLTHFLVVEAGDTEAAIVAEVGFSPLVNAIDGARFGSPDFHPWWDWLQNVGGWFELIVTVGNSGFAFVLLIEDREGTDPELVRMCRALAGERAERGILCEGPTDAPAPGQRQ